MNYHFQSREEVLSCLGSSSKGLSRADIERLRAEHGTNALQERPPKPFLLRVWGQIKDPMVMVLMAAAVISGLLGELADSVIIFSVIVINTAIGLVQENKAEKAIEALKKMSAQSAKVVRDGTTSLIDAVELVPGDVVLLDAGDLVPADLRLLETSSLKIEEASLTGESVPSDKNAAAEVEEICPLGDRKNLAFYGTSVTYGRARGVVVATGMKTEMGKIADMLNKSGDNTTPLQKKLDEIGKTLTYVVGVICAVMFATIIFKSGGFTPEGTLHAFMLSISLAVAAIPEGLPAIVTIVMAIGVTKMARRRAIIKKLPAVETLGCADVICSDKTGTLTQNKMNVREIWQDGQNSSADEFIEKNADSLLARILYLCNDSEIAADGSEIGDPTETCLKRFVLRKRAPSDFSYKRLRDMPFDSERKMMSTVNDMGADGVKVFTKGAPDEVLKRCTHMLVQGNAVALDDEYRRRILEGNRAMASKALRVLGCACRDYDAKNNSGKDNELEEALTFVGLVGMIDPPRPEVFEAIEKCKHAGIRTVMITGDHRDTAIAIAKEIGILQDDSQAIFGQELDTMDDRMLDARLEDIKVYARVSPEHKVRIVEAWQRKHKVVAMTGDGVNDAPALKKSDIGIGMGITGTDVSKGVSDMLLSDDNFATIVNAVEEGRKIYKNIRKSVQFLLSSNASEVLSLFCATLILPAGVIFLSPVHILWINLVTDSLPAIALGMDKGDENIMNEPPRDSRANFFGGGLGVDIFYQGVLMALLTLVSYWFGARQSPQEGTTMAFITLSTVQLFHVFNVKVGNGTVFSAAAFNNSLLIVAALIPTILVAGIVNIPFFAGVFRVVPLTLAEWALAVGLSFIVVPLDEFVRFLKKKYA